MDPCCIRLTNCLIILSNCVTSDYFRNGILDFISFILFPFQSIYFRLQSYGPDTNEIITLNLPKGMSLYVYIQGKSWHTFYMHVACVCVCVRACVRARVWNSELQGNVHNYMQWVRCIWSMLCHSDMFILIILEITLFCTSSELPGIVQEVRLLAINIFF